MTEQAQLESETKLVQQHVNEVGEGKLSTVPLLHLVKQLLRNICSQTVTHLQDLTLPTESPEEKANLNLLLKFQRLLFSFLLSPPQSEVLDEEPSIPSKSDHERDMKGALSILMKYIYLLSNHLLELLPMATTIGSENRRNFYLVSSILNAYAIGVLLSEFILCLTLLQLERPALLNQISLSCLTFWLQSLDNFNKLSPGLERDDLDDMSWPRINRYGSNISSTHLHKSDSECPSIRKADLENHNLDKGHWIVIRGKVYDVQDFKASAPCGPDAFSDLNNLDATSAFDSHSHSDEAKDMLESFFLGHLVDPDIEMSQLTFTDLSNLSSPFLDTERNLAYFLGLYNHSLYESLPLSPAEKNSIQLTKSVFLKGGLKTRIHLDPFDETKGDFSNFSSQQPTPISTPTDGAASSSKKKPDDENATESVQMVHGKHLLQTLAESNLKDSALNVFLGVIGKLSREQNLMFLMNFPPEHPVEECGRVVLAILIKYQGLEEYIAHLVKLTLPA